MNEEINASIKVSVISDDASEEPEETPIDNSNELDTDSSEDPSDELDETLVDNSNELDTDSAAVEEKDQTEPA